MLVTIFIVVYFVVLQKDSEKVSKGDRKKEEHKKRPINTNTTLIETSNTDEKILVEILTGIKSIGENISIKFKTDNNTNLEANISFISNKISLTNSLNKTIIKYFDSYEENDFVEQTKGVLFIKDVSACIVACCLFRKK